MVETWRVGGAKTAFGLFQPARLGRTFGGDGGGWRRVVAGSSMVRPTQSWTSAILIQVFGLGGDAGEHSPFIYAQVMKAASKITTGLTQTEA
jgi:hypothetical protein